MKRERVVGVAGPFARSRHPALVPSLVAGFGLIVTALACAQEQPPPPPSGEILRLPGITITAPARLPGSPLPLSHVPGAVDVIEGEAIRRSGATSLQDFLTRLPGITVNDEQGNRAQPDVSFRGFQATSVTGVPQGISVFVDGVRVNVDQVPRLLTFPARWVLEDPRSRSYFVFWSDPGGKLVRALLMAPSDEELPEHRRVRRIGEKDSDERRQNHDDSRCRSRVDDDRIQDGLPALGAGDRSSELASRRDA